MIDIIFLDFDGVLHASAERSMRFGYCALLLEALQEHPQTKLVVSSDWRVLYDIEELRDLLGAGLGARVIDVTPDLSAVNELEPWPTLQTLRDRWGLRMLRPLGARQREVQAWLDVHAPTARWLALEDIPWFFDEGCANVLLFKHHGGQAAQASAIAAFNTLRRVLAGSERVAPLQHPSFAWFAAAMHTPVAPLAEQRSILVVDQNDVPLRWRADFERAMVGRSYAGDGRYWQQDWFDFLAKAFHEVMQ